MNSRSRSRIGRALLCALAVLPSAVAHAQWTPNRPVRLVVPYPPGGANDIVGRMLAQKMTERLGQNFVVDNRGGGNTIIGSELVAKAPADGHTLLMVAAGHAINPSLYPKLPYNTAKDFAPVALVGDGAYVLVAHPGAGVSTVGELVSLAKAKPGQVTYASSSIGNLTHLAAELFASLAGAKMLHVPYKGGGPAMVDLLGGRVSIFFSTVAVARPNIQSGKVRALGVTTPRRSLALPNVPSIAEAGLPGYEVSGWYGMVVPSATPKAAIAALHAAVQHGIAQPDIKERLLGVGVEAVEMSSAQFGARIDADIAKWNKVVPPLKIKVE